MKLNVKLKTIVATKEASGNIVQIAQIIRDAEPGFSVYSGNDNEIVPILSVGGIGVISVAANLIPTVMSRIAKLYLSGNTQESNRLFLKYLPLFNDLFVDVNPVPVKHALDVMGFDVGSCRLPLVAMSDADIKILDPKFSHLDL